MSIIPDWYIEQLARCNGMIQPLNPGHPKDGGWLSAGITSYGYDMTLGWEFREIKEPEPRPETSFPPADMILNPKRPNPDFFLKKVVVPGDCYYLRPHSFALGVTVERFKIPRDMLVLCLGKSTYARAGLNINITPLEPEWEGHLTIELKNESPYWLQLFPGEGIGQLVFLKSEHECRTSYADKKGKYQNQSSDPTLPKG